MAFPATALDVEVSIALSADLSDPVSWTWTNITSYVREDRRIRIQRGRSSERSTMPPSRCTLTVDNTDGRFCRLLPTGAWYGQIDKNTPLRVRVNNGSGYVTRFVGYVSGWPPSWDPSETDQTVTLTADGILRRLGQGRVLRPALERAILGSSPSAYWTLQDESGSTSAASALAGGARLAANSLVEFGSGTLVPGGASAVVDMSAGGYLTGATGVAQGAVASWEMEGMFGWTTLPPNSSQVNLIAGMTTPGSSIGEWGIGTFESSGTLRFGIYRLSSGGTSLGFSSQPILAGVLYHFRIRMEQNGADVDFTRWLDGVQVGSGSETGVTLYAPVRARVNGDASLTQMPQSLSHLGVWVTVRATADTYLAADGYAGEQAHERVDRLCTEEGVPVTVTATTSQAMGAQGVDTLVNLLRECATTDFGLLYEPLDAGLAYRSSTERYNQTAAITLDYSAGQIAPPWDPSDDDRDFRNDVTASKSGGSSARVADEDSITAVGVYDDTISANTETDEQLPNVAGWAVNLGTVDELRWPAVKPNFLKHPSLIDSWMAADLGDLLHVTGHPSPLAPDDIRQVIEGYDETFGSFEYTAVANLSPASGWDVAEWDDAGLARFAADGSTLYAAISSSATSWSVKPNGTRWTTDAADFTPDMQVIVGGEVAEVSAIADAATFVAAGTAAHGDNASVVPGLPAGLAEGDEMFMFAAIRNTTGGAVTTPAGWTSVMELTSGNSEVFRKTAGASESAPTVSFTGGAAGDTTSAQICAFRGLSSTRVTFSSAQSNSSAQDITYPSLTMLGVDGETDDCVVLLVAWKQDDWTSVAPPSGFTEIGEPSSTTGNDQGLYWAYQIQTHRADIKGGTITVTGGASAISRARLVAYAGLQTFTVAARSVNGVVKAHSAGDEVQVYRPFRWAL